MSLTVADVNTISPAARFGYVKAFKQSSVMVPACLAFTTLDSGSNAFLAQ